MPHFQSRSDTRLLNASCALVWEDLVFQTLLAASWVCRAGLKQVAYRSLKQVSVIAAGCFLLGEGKRSAVSRHLCPLVWMECSSFAQAHGLLTGLPGSPSVLSLCAFQCIACRIYIKWQLWRNPHGVRLKINGQHLLFYFYFGWLLPEYPTVPRDLWFNSDARICKRWLMNMRFQGRSLSVTWDLCRDSYYSRTPPLLVCFRRHMNHHTKAPVFVNQLKHNTDVGKLYWVNWATSQSQSFT